MKIIIVGNGKVGYAIASQLAGEHHDITMVDSSFFKAGDPRRCTGRRTPWMSCASRETAPPSVS